jgi:predicted metal-dependent hydrolase
MVFGYNLRMSIPIDKIIRTSRKTIALIVQRDGTLVVRAPTHMPEYHIRDFVEKHEGWIVKTRGSLRSSSIPEKKYVEGETFFYLGKSFPLRIFPSHKKALTFNGEYFQMNSSSFNDAEKNFKKWYKIQARRFLEENVRLLALQFGFTYNNIRISSARTRWGSCSSKNTLSFTYRLIMAPPEVIRYVVIHELVHTKIKNHSKSFWGAVGKILPDYKKYRTWLKKYGSMLV